MSTFTLHPQLAKDTLWITDFFLCKALLMNDSNYPWIILVPQVVDIYELHELNHKQRRALWDESERVSNALLQLFDSTKLNIAALGNIVPQLHIHHIARRTDDAAWPAPVWGKLPAQPYEADFLDNRLKLLRRALA